MNNPNDQFDILASVKLALSNEEVLRKTLSEFISEKRKCGFKVNESTRAAFRRIPGWQVISIASVFGPTTTVEEIVANLKRMHRDMTRGWIDPLS